MEVSVGMETYNKLLDSKSFYRNFCWIMKEFKPRKAFDEKDVQYPAVFQYRVINNPEILDFIKSISKETGREENDVKEEVERIVEEIGYSRNLTLCRWFGLILTRIINKVQDNVFINQSKLLTIKSNMGRNPVIYLPSHRSYMDFILVTLINYVHDIEFPVVVAGMDFYRMLGVSNIIRNYGALFMRRTFNNDKLYSGVFKKYVNTVLTEGSAPFEFFIEGTRSRNGKSLTPKLGLLKMVWETYINGQVPDVTLIPISISYDRILEELLFVYEVLGFPKPKESTWGFLKGIYNLDERYGNIYITLANPISLKEFVQDFYKDCENPLQDLAYEIVSSQQNSSILTPFNILSMVLLDYLRNGKFNKKYPKLMAITEDVIRVKEILVQFGSKVYEGENFEREIEESIKIHKSLLTVSEEGDVVILDIHGSIVPKNQQKTIFRKVNEIPYEFMRRAVPVIMLQHYANGAMYSLINPAIISIIVNSAEQLLNQEMMREKFFKLREIFADEFVLPAKKHQQEFEKTMNLMLKNGIIKKSDDNQYESADDKVVHFLSALLFPFLKTYALVCQHFNENVECWYLMETVVCKVRHKLKENNLKINITELYGLSTQPVTSCVLSLCQLGILIEFRDNGPPTAYKVGNQNELINVIKMIDELMKVDDDSDAVDVLPRLSCKL